MPAVLLFSPQRNTETLPVRRIIIGIIRIMRTRQFDILQCGALLFALLPYFPCFAQSAPTTQQQIESHSRQAQEYLREKKLDLAATEFRAIVALDPKNVDARGNLGTVLFFQGAYADAIPQQSDLPPSVQLELYKSGGHMGFIAGAFPWRAQYWLEERLPSYLQANLICSG